MVFRTDFHRLSIPEKLAKVGPGNPGAKSRELDAFEPEVSELSKGAIILPPRIRITGEFFHAALRRIGILDANDSFCIDKKDVKIQFTANELEVLHEIFVLTRGFAIAIRSDEETAKGVGLFKSLFFINLGESGQSFEDFIAQIETVIKSQFSDETQFFSKKTGSHTPSIGIQIMPLIGEFFEMQHGRTVSRLYGPLVSTAGITYRNGQNGLVSIGLGIGGGVALRAPKNYLGELELGTHIGLRGNQVFGLPPGMAVHLSTVCGERSLDSQVRPLQIIFNGISGSRYQRFEQCDGSAWYLMQQLAQLRQHDIYAEIHQCTVEGQMTWALTQIAPVFWPLLGKPSTEQVISGQQVIGCGKRKIERYFLMDGSDEKDSVARFNLLNEGYVIVAKGHIRDLPSFQEMSNARVFFDASDHYFDWSSHLQGGLREMGIPYIRITSSQANVLIAKMSQGDAFEVYANEPQLEWSVHVFG